jgi:hypothetical protein
MPDYTPLNHKLEDAFVAYVTSILTDLVMDGVQVVSAHQSAEELETPRIVCECTSMAARDIILPGWMDCEVAIHYITQDGNLTAEEHKTNAGTILSWLLDIATVKAAIDANDDLSTLLYQFSSVSMEANADEGTRTSMMSFTLIAAGA